MFGSTAFDAFVVHQSACDRIVEEIAGGITSIDYIDDLTDSDFEYIKKRLRTEYGIEVDFN